MSTTKEEKSGSILVPFDEHQRIALINVMNEMYNGSIMFQRRVSIIEAQLESANRINEVWQEFPPQTPGEAQEYAQLVDKRMHLLSEHNYWSSLSNETNTNYNSLEPLLTYISL